MTAPQLSAPHERIRTGRMRHNAERWSWMFMRISGAILMLLIFTHLIVNLVLGEGVSQIDFAFVAGKWAAWYWQVADFLMLVLALIHGGNGMRLLINDYAHRTTTRKVLHSVLGVAVVAVIVLGSLVIWTFDPCPVDADPSLLPGFCASVAG
ncbi:succinate dehydrogenase hydrophobic membrane anchor subunit [Demequina capsici]|uniref:Succinate dehydrogenase hydrophobic membrane anchor subunit n=2 Tax=Demequina capsici TaxID=3075620 RepID=A0AA96F946_9MICO|nr:MULTISPECIES: succinate dehydrogenase hydrophobic membrane anchor subunit [unclassified Demequina]WNM26028.1 succinate dehydrogenase hydrophobic membrane anchor subunit [Demequina sp. OYTSA14]WNM28902.1 succinate dehydrogenase hydrophobic membrane anchor subunit [Demequina sp. PMTSA13]